MNNRILVALSLPVLAAGLFALSACKDDSDDPPTAPTTTVYVPVPSASVTTEIIPVPSVSESIRVVPSASKSIKVVPSASRSISPSPVHRDILPGHGR